MKSRFLNYVLIGVALALLVFAYFFYDEKKPIRLLPYYGKITFDSTISNGNLVVDSIYHAVSDFSLTDQFGDKVSFKNLEGKIFVADFFFANCKGICIKMSGNMEQVYKTFKKNPNVILLSHTVDPERDTSEALAWYAKMHGVDDKQWLFLTGDKKQIYDLARNSYLVSATKGDGGPDDFVHTENFALVDKEKHIRGYYDGTDSLEVKRLIVDIGLLLKESAYNKKTK